jgi:ribosomal protein L30/L7E
MFTPTNWSHSVFDKNQCIQDFVLLEDREKEYIAYLNTLPIAPGGTIYSYNVFFPYGAIAKEDKELVRAILKPTQEMKNYIQKTMSALRLGGVKGYIVVHIRSGDTYLLHRSTEFARVYINVIKREIEQVMFENKERRVLLIADNNEIKGLLKNVFKNRVTCLFQEITHLGEGAMLMREKVKNTLLDFYLMSGAHSIYSWTTYPHGSGFSYWCALVFNIPYKCRYVAT